MDTAGQVLLALARLDRQSSEAQEDREADDDGEDGCDGIDHGVARGGAFEGGNDGAQVRENQGNRAAQDCEDHDESKHLSDRGFSNVANVHEAANNALHTKGYVQLITV